MAKVETSNARRTAVSMLGRPLRGNEMVHHINGDQTDNRPDNLSVMTTGEHLALHARNRRNGITLSKAGGRCSLSIAKRFGPVVVTAREIAFRRGQSASEYIWQAVEQRNRRNRSETD